MNPVGIARRLILVIALMGLLLPLAGPTPAATIIYVDADATGLDDGSSWTDAYTDLQSALAAATAGDQIWVAAGTYTPGTEPTATFAMKEGVAIYGGFAGTESDLGERDWETNVTTLSGDIGTLGDAADNVYHVVTAAGDIDSTAVLDGFTISGGYAYGDGQDQDRGAGILIDQSSPTLANLRISGNQAYYMGAGLDNEAGAPTLSNVRFEGNIVEYASGGGLASFSYSEDGTVALTNVDFVGNSAGGWGGGLYVLQSPLTATNVSFSGNSADVGAGMSVNGSTDGTPFDVTLTNAVFYNNEAIWASGGLYVYGASVSATVTNGTFSGNSSDESGAVAVRDGSMVLTNCVLWGDTGEIALFTQYTPPSVTVTYSIVQGGYTGTGNLDADPKFVSASDLHLQANSPAIDSGDNGAVPGGVTTDIDGNARFMNDSGVPDTGSGTAPFVDRGAYEFQGASVPLNTAPAPNAGGPYSVDEGGSISLTGSATDAEGGDLTYAWDLDNNGTYESAGQSVTFSAAMLDGPGSQTVGLRVCDSEPLCGVCTTTVGIDNVAPVVNAGSDAIIGEGDAFSQAGSFTDPGPDTWDATVDYGDGSGEQTLALTGKTFSLNHTYAAIGDYTVTVTVTDDDGGSDTDTVEVSVVGLPPAGVVVMGPTSGVAGVAYSFTAQVSPVDAATPITYTWTATDFPTPIVHSSGTNDTVQYTWTAPGTKTVSVMVKNDGEPQVLSGEVGVAQSPIYTNSLNINIAAAPAPTPPEVPEPGSLLLLASGLAGLGGFAGLRSMVRRRAR